MSVHKEISKRINKYHFSEIALILFIGIFLGILSGKLTPPSSNKKNETIIIDGSSTVFPITDLAVSNFISNNKPTQNIIHGISGTSGGFRKFCSGEIDMGNASRLITPKEESNCKSNGIDPIAFPVAYDAITIVVNLKNDWAQDITRDELQKIWSERSEGNLKKWSDIRTAWPNHDLILYGPDKDSGTLDYFIEIVLGSDSKSLPIRNDYNKSKFDWKIVLSVANNVNSLGFLGFQYYAENSTFINALSIDSGDGPVLPSKQTVKLKAYLLSRPLYIYINRKKIKRRHEFKKLTRSYLKNSERLVKELGYIPLPSSEYNNNLMKLNSILD